MYDPSPLRPTHRDLKTSESHRLTRLSSLIAGMLILAFGSACSTDWMMAPMAVRMAPTKQPAVSETDLGAKASSTFRSALYDADYDRLPEVLHLLTAAYLETPTDPELTLLLAHAHLWRLAERSRTAELDPRITDHILLADHYFSEAQALAPGDTRIDGWQGAVRMARGTINQNESVTRSGYFQLRKGARNYLAFNGFSAAYPLSIRPRDSAHFAEGLEYMWRNIEKCTNGRVDRTNLDYARLLDLETDTGTYRVCWSTDLVPHNLEGFFLLMGDMLTKAGDVATARNAYETAKLSPSYRTWRYSALLDQRLNQLDQRASAFALAASLE